MADALYGGLATSAFPVSPATLDDAKFSFKYRPKPGKVAAIEYKAVKASETILQWDFLTITQGSNSDQLERALDPAGAAGENMSGGSGNLVRYVALHDHTSTSSVDENSVMAVMDVFNLQFLMRLQHSSGGSSAEIQDIRLNFRVQIPVGGAAVSTDFFDWGYWEIGTGSDNYFPIVDVQTAPTNALGVAIVEAATESDVTDDHGLVWVEFSGLS